MGCGSSAANNDAAKAADKKKENDGTGNTRDQDKKTAKQENQHYQDTMKFLSQVQLLKRLPKDQHPILASIAKQVDFKAGQEVIRQGESGDAFYVIKSGEASVN